MPHQLRAEGGAEPDRALGEDGDGVADPHAARLRAADAGRGDVGEQDHLFVGNAIRDLCQIGLRARDEEVLGLRAVDGVAEAPAADRFVAVAVSALRELAGEAGVALAAWGDGAHDDALADRVAGHADSELFDDADRLVADDEARLDGILAAGDVKIGAADRRHRDANDGLARPGARFRHIFDADVIDAVKDGSAHRGDGVRVGDQHLFYFECRDHVAPFCGLAVSGLRGLAVKPVSVPSRSASVIGAWSWCDGRHFDVGRSKLVAGGPHCDEDYEEDL
jgi:hypothetical protein